MQARGLVNVAKVRVGSLLEQEADEVNAVGLVEVLHGKAEKRAPFVIFAVHVDPFLLKHTLDCSSVVV